MGNPAIVAALPPSLRSLVQELHIQYIRPVISFDPTLSRYDQALFYTMKPNVRFRQHGPEFSVVMKTNSAGLRDDEDSLKNYDAVLLGDSFALGWGVGDDELFAAHVERMTGLKLLNCSVNSYGTIREVLLMNRVLTPPPRILIVQYHVNDAYENAYYHRIRRRPVADYDNLVKWNGKKRRPWSNFSALLGMLHDIGGDWVAGRPGRAVDAKTFARRDVDNFLHALAGAAFTLNRTRIIVMPVSNSSFWEKEFIRQLRDRIASEELPEYLRKITVIDISKGLGQADFYVIDDHPNASGHRKMAELVAIAISTGRDMTFR